MKFTLDFGKHDATGNGIKDNLVEVEVQLDEGEQPRLSICGTIWNRLKTDCISAGQNLDEIRELTGVSPFRRWRLMRRVHYIWKRYHLNDMKAGSPRQEAYLAGYKAAGGELDDWKHAVDLLERAGLEPDTQHNDYRYGIRWLYTPIPDDVIAEIATWKEESE